MISSSRSFSALTLLFICFFISSRYIQNIIFDRDLQNSNIFRHLTSTSSCNPRDNSVLSHYIKNKKRVLIVILDAYPDSIIYKQMQGKESNLHNYIKSSAIEFKEGMTSIPYTYRSIPYLLGKIHPTHPNCRFPFFNGDIKPNLLLASGKSGTHNSICYQTFENANIFFRVKKNIRKLIFTSYRNFHAKDYESCSFANRTIHPKLISQLQSNQNKSKISFLHELKYHHWLEDLIANNDIRNISKLKFYDSNYLEGIKYLHSNLKKYDLVDELIVMSDHGPRLGIYGKSSETFKENNLIDHDYFGYFFARIPISEEIKKETSVINLLPTSKFRYDVSPKGNAILLNKFQPN